MSKWPARSEIIIVVSQLDQASGVGFPGPSYHPTRAYAAVSSPSAPPCDKARPAHTSVTTATPPGDKATPGLQNGMSRLLVRTTGRVAPLAHAVAVVVRLSPAFLFPCRRGMMRSCGGGGRSGCRHVRREAGPSLRLPGGLIGGVSVTTAKGWLFPAILP
jgi:hypothetical protein